MFGSGAKTASRVPTTASAIPACASSHRLACSPPESSPCKTMIFRPGKSRRNSSARRSARETSGARIKARFPPAKPPPTTLRKPPSALFPSANSAAAIPKNPSAIQFRAPLDFANRSVNFIIAKKSRRINRGIFFGDFGDKRTAKNFGKAAKAAMPKGAKESSAARRISVINSADSGGISEKMRASGLILDSATADFFRAATASPTAILFRSGASTRHPTAASAEIPSGGR